MEPKKVTEALIDPDWVIALQDELNQFERQITWKLVPRSITSLYLVLHRYSEVTG